MARRPAPRRPRTAPAGHGNTPRRLTPGAAPRALQAELGGRDDLTWCRRSSGCEPVPCALDVLAQDNQVIDQVINTLAAAVPPERSQAEHGHLRAVVGVDGAADLYAVDAQHSVPPGFADHGS